MLNKERVRNMKKFLALCLVVFTLIFTVSCFAQTTYTNDGLKLTVPEEYADKLLVETPDNQEKDSLFSVYEIESIEAAKGAGFTWEGAGWLFSINRVSEERMQELRCSEMSGYIIFAKDTAGNYYVFNHPTDVRFVREDYSDPAALEIWGKLNEWGHSVRKTFIEENEGLTAETYGNTELDIAFARMKFLDDTNYTVTTLEYGEQKPNGIKAADYIDALTHDVVFVPDRDAETPDGEYVMLNFPDIDLRFDFFLLDGKENYIRQVWFNGEHELMYRAEFKDETLKAGEIMEDFYKEMVLHNTLAYTPDDMVGSWAEKIAGRGVIEITKGTEDGKYDIRINWSASAFQKAYWEMTAEATGHGAELRYENGKHSILTWESEDKMTEEEVYTNGIGSFDLLSTYELTWNDETGHAADDTVFINAGK